MSGQLFAKIIPHNNILLIHSFLYKKKDSDFIKRWLPKICTLTQIKMWPLLIRDSKNLQIHLPIHELSTFNFTTFIQQMNSINLAPLLKFFKQFCIQSIKNNKQLLYNKYYVGNGGHPACQFITSYLTTRSINGTTFYYSYDEMHQALYEILYNVIQDQQKCMEQEMSKSTKYFDKFDNIKFMLYSLRLSVYTTCRTSQTVDLILRMYMKFYKQQQIMIQKLKVQTQHLQPDLPQQKRNQILNQYNNNLYMHQHSNKLIQQFFISLFSIYQGNAKRIQDSWKWRKQSYYQQLQQFMQQEYLNTKVVFYRIIQSLNYNFQELLEKFKYKISKILLSIGSVKLLMQLVNMENFRKIIIFSQCFIFPLFLSKNRNVLQFIWSFQLEKQKICKFQKDGKNILQVVCQSKGLTHNIIKMLWQSRNFSKMPEIKNKKSRQIIFKWLKQQSTNQQINK